MRTFPDVFLRRIQREIVQFLLVSGNFIAVRVEACLELCGKCGLRVHVALLTSAELTMANVFVAVCCAGWGCEWRWQRLCVCVSLAVCAVLSPVV